MPEGRTANQAQSYKDRRKAAALPAPGLLTPAAGTLNHPGRSHYENVRNGAFMSKRKLVEDMKLNPQRFYRAPSDVTRDRRFSDAERLEILDAWEGTVDAGSQEHQQVSDVRKEIERKQADNETSALKQ